MLRVLEQGAEENIWEREKVKGERRISRSGKLHTYV
jgi:hypothetical protein